MANYYYGELGYNHEAEFDSIEAAIEGAVQHSVTVGLTPICVWDAADDVQAVVVLGDVFEKRT